MPIERVDHWATDGIAWARVLPLFDALIRGEKEADVRDDLWLLQDRGFDHVILVYRSQPDGNAEAAMTALCGPPKRATNGLLWKLPRVEATEEEGALWRAEQAARVATGSSGALGTQFPSQDPTPRGAPPAP